MTIFVNDLFAQKILLFISKVVKIVPKSKYSIMRLK